MPINNTDTFLVNRSNESYQVAAEDLMAELKEDDLMLVNRNGASYKATGQDIIDSLGQKEVAPEIASISVTELAPNTAQRFTDQEFDVDVEMLENGIPGSVKTITAKVEGNLYVAPQTDAIESIDDNAGTTPAWETYDLTMPDSKDQWRKLKYLNGQYIILNNGSNPIDTTLLTSPDGKTWTKVEAVFDKSNHVPYDICFGGPEGQEKYVLADYDNHGTVWHSSDLVNWTSVQIGQSDANPTTGRFNCCDWNGEYFIVGSQLKTSGLCRFIYSSDGVNWTRGDELTSGSVFNLGVVDIASGGGVTYAVGSSTSQCAMYSYYQDKWINGSGDVNGTSNAMKAIVYVPDRNIFVSTSSKYIFATDPGNVALWKKYTIPNYIRETTGNLTAPATYSIAYDPSNKSIVCGAAANMIFRTFDLDNFANWEVTLAVSETPYTGQFYAICAREGEVTAALYNDPIGVYSDNPFPPGQTKTQLTFETDQDLDLLRLSDKLTQVTSPRLIATVDKFTTLQNGIDYVANLKPLQDDATINNKENVFDGTSTTFSSGSTGAIYVLDLSETPLDGLVQLSAYQGSNQGITLEVVHNYGKDLYQVDYSTSGSSQRTVAAAETLYGITEIRYQPGTKNNPAATTSRLYWIKIDGVYLVQNTVPNQPIVEFKDVNSYGYVIEGDVLIGDRGSFVLGAPAENGYTYHSMLGSVSPDDQVQGSPIPAYGYISDIDVAQKNVKVLSIIGEFSTGQECQSVPYLQGSSERYLNFDSTGAISDISVAPPDPAYSSFDPNPSITLKFPSVMPSGNAPDSEFLEGSTLVVSAQASNVNGTSNIVEDNVTPEGPTQGDVYGTTREGLVRLYTGAGTGTGTTTFVNTGIDMQTNDGLVWIKGRKETSSNQAAHRIWDTKRGPFNYLQVSSIAAQELDINTLLEFDYNGFLLGRDTYISYADEPYVTFSIPTAPNLLDIQTYLGSGSGSQTISHNLQETPKLMIVKSINENGAWIVYHEAAGNGAAGNLGNNLAWLYNYIGWNNTTPTDTEFQVASELNTAGTNYVAYLFGDTPNVSKVGSYFVNTTDQVVDMGFRPQWIMFKVISSGKSGNWSFFDSTRGMGSGVDNRLTQGATAEVKTQNYFSVTDTGIILNGTSTTDVGQNGFQYIYLAFAEPPAPAGMSSAEFTEQLLKNVTYDNRAMVNCGNQAQAKRDDLAADLIADGYSQADIDAVYGD